MTSEQERTSGTLMRGADGALCFIPDDALATFRVPEEQAAQVQEILDEPGDVQGFALSTPQLQPLATVKAIVVQGDARAIIIQLRPPSTA